MKKIVNIIFILLTATSLSSIAQSYGMNSTGSVYGMNISQFTSGSGHGSGYSISANILNNRKCIEVGVVYQDKQKKIAGADLRYKIFLGDFNKLKSNSKLVRHYIQFNILYHKASVMEPTILSTETAGTIQIPAEEKSTIATFEHYLSYGAQIKIVNNIFIDSSIGIGMYKGSLSKINQPNTIGFHGENHGFTGYIKFGVGYSFF